MQQTEILFVAEKASHWSQYLDNSEYRIFQMAPGKSESKHILDQEYDIVIFHGMPDANSLAIIKQNYPWIPILILADNIPEEQQYELLKLDVDDIITGDVNPSEFRLRLQWALKKQQKKRVLFHYERNLHALGIILRFMQSSGSIEDILHALCENFNLMGVTLIPEDEYSPTRVIIQGEAHFRDVPTFNQRNDPFARVIESGKSQYYADISAHPYYTPIPLLIKPTSAIVIKLPQNDRNLSAIGVYGTHNNPLIAEDVALLDIFGEHFAHLIASLTVSPPIHSDSHLLPIWQQLIELSN